MATTKKRRKAAAANTTTLMIRCTDAQRRSFERQATGQGLSISTWARMILVRESNGLENRRPR